MSHYISGIVTSFKCEGDLPHLYLVGNYAFIPLNSKNDGFKGYAMPPFSPHEAELTQQIAHLAKELSFSGSTAYIETDYFGGDGHQIATVWKDGRKVFGPEKSDDAINKALKTIGIWKHEGKDEFDTARLGMFSTNKEILETIERESLTSD